MIRITEFVVVFFFAGIFGVFGATSTSEILTVNCDNIELIADSAWVICQHDKKGFTWEDVEKCEVNDTRAIEIAFRYVLKSRFKEKITSQS